MSTDDPLTCSRCHNPVSPNANSCWRCGGHLPMTANPKTDQTLEFSKATSPYPPVHSTAANRSTFSISSMMLITTLIAACIALIVAVPGLGILLTVFSLPPLIRTVILVRRRINTGRPVDNSSKVTWFLGSLGATMLVTFVTCTFGCAAFLFSCLALVPFASAGHDSGIIMTFIFATASSLTVAGYILWRCSFWMQDRWRRDTES
jgi:hypothetical protein